MTFSPWSHILSGALLDVSLRSVVLAAVAELVVFGIRKRSAATEHALWTAVLGGMLLLPVLRSITPDVAIPTSSPQVMKIATEWRGITAGPVMARPQIPMIVRSGDDPDPDRWLRWGSILYFGGVIVFLARLVAGIVLTRRSLESVRSIRGESEVRALVAEGSILTVPVAESGQVTTPVTVGWPDGTIVLPLEWRSWPASRLRMVVAHEAAHVSRRDSLITLFAALNKAVFWFHPLAWFLERRLTALAELSADDAVLSSSGEAHAYADTLIEIARRRSSSRFANGIAMAGAGKIGRRIDRILAGRAGSTGIGAWARGVLWAGSLAVVCATAMLHVQILNAQSPMGSAMEFLHLPHASGEMPKAAQDRVGQLEQALLQDPEDAQARVELFGLYTAYGRIERAWQLVSWMIGNHPEFDGFGRFVGRALRIDPRADAEGHQKEIALWRIQAEKHPESFAVLQNAAQIMDDPREQIVLMKRAHALDPKRPLWPNLYGMYSLVLTRGDRCAAVPVDNLCDPALTDFVRSDLASSNDPALIGAIGIELVKSAATAELTHRTGFDYAGIRAMSLDLLTRAASLEPGNQDWPNAMEGARQLRGATK